MTCLTLTLGFCPAIRAELCQNLSSPEPSCDFSNIPLATQLAPLIQFLQETLTLVFGQLSDLKTELNHVLDLTQTMIHAASQFDWAFWVAAGSALALAVLTLLVMLAVLLSCIYPRQSFPIFSCFRTWLVLPLFILFVVLGWVFSMIFVISSMATSDFCINSPDDSVLSILGGIQTQNPSPAYYFLVYYIKGCPKELLPEELKQKVSLLRDFLLPSLANFTTSLQEQGATNFETTCGSGLTPLLAGVAIVNNQLCILGKALVSSSFCF